MVARYGNNGDMQPGCGSGNFRSEKAAPTMPVMSAAASSASPTLTALVTDAELREMCLSAFTPNELQWLVQSTLGAWIEINSDSHASYAGKVLKHVSQRPEFGILLMAAGAKERPHLPEYAKIYNRVAQAKNLPMTERISELSIPQVARALGIINYDEVVAIAKIGDALVFAEDIRILAHSMSLSEVSKQSHELGLSGIKIEAPMDSVIVKAILHAPDKAKTTEDMIWAFHEASPFHEGIRKILAKILGEQYQPLSAAQRYPIAFDINDRDVLVSHSKNKIELTSKGVAAVFDLTMEIVGGVNKAFAAIANQLGLNGQVHSSQNPHTVLNFIRTVNDKRLMEKFVGILLWLNPEHEKLKQFAQANNISSVELTGFDRALRFGGGVSKPVVFKFAQDAVQPANGDASVFVADIKRGGAYPVPTTTDYFVGTYFLNWDAPTRHLADLALLELGILPSEVYKQDASPADKGSKLAEFLFRHQIADRFLAIASRRNPLDERAAAAVRILFPEELPS